MQPMKTPTSLVGPWFLTQVILLQEFQLVSTTLTRPTLQWGFTGLLNNADHTTSSQLQSKYGFSTPYTTIRCLQVKLIIQAAQLNSTTIRLKVKVVSLLKRIGPICWVGETYLHSNLENSGSYNCKKKVNINKSTVSNRFKYYLSNSKIPKCYY